MGGDKPVKFQSTLPRRERLPFSATVPILIRISIHAPAKGATSSILSTRPSMTISIHAPAKGATRFRNFLKEKCIFQSTLPRRERRTFEICIQISFNNFNPRSREGSDNEADLQYPDYTISIHAPAKGATRLHWTHPVSCCNFNPRSREGSDTVAELGNKTANTISIHAPAKGATSLSVLLTKLYTFQSTLPRRERHL